MKNIIIIMCLSVRFHLVIYLFVRQIEFLRFVIHTPTKPIPREPRMTSELSKTRFEHLGI